MDVIEELKFLGKFKKCCCFFLGGTDWVGGGGGWQVRVDVNEKLKFF